MKRCATATIPTPSVWPSRAKEKSGRRNRLTELGVERAKFWGWPNIYTYAKALGEQLVAAETDIVRSIVRPSIVESAKSYPFPGWNEGFTTTAPIIFMTLKGQRQLPGNPKLILDITPVDQVAAVMLAVACPGLRRAAEAGLPGRHRGCESQ
jgi:long-chain acyl-CoA synthetase